MTQCVHLGDVIGKLPAGICCGGQPAVHACQCLEMQGTMCVPEAPRKLPFKIAMPIELPDGETLMAAPVACIGCGYLREPSRPPDDATRARELRQAERNRRAGIVEPELPSVPVPARQVVDRDERNRE